MLHQNFPHAKVQSATLLTMDKSSLSSFWPRRRKNNGKTQRFQPKEQQSEEKSGAVNHQLEGDKSFSFTLSDLFPITHPNREFCF